MICTPYCLKLDSFVISEAAVKCLNLVSYLINTWHKSTTQIYKQKLILHLFTWQVTVISCLQESTILSHRLAARYVSRCRGFLVLESRCRGICDSTASFSFSLNLLCHIINVDMCIVNLWILFYVS